MPIVFEPTKDYERLKGNLYQSLVERYLIGKRFSSLEEALAQSHKGKSLLDYGFYVGELRPKNLPINEADVFVDVHLGEEAHPSFLTHLSVLRARFVN